MARFGENDAIFNAICIVILQPSFAFFLDPLTELPNSPTRKFVEIKFKNLFLQVSVSRANLHSQNVCLKNAFGSPDGNRTRSLRLERAAC